MWPSSFYTGKSEDSYSVCTWKNLIFLQSMWLSSCPKWGSEDSYSVSTWKNKIFLQSMWSSSYRKQTLQWERERGTGVLTLYYFYSSPDTIQCSLSLSLCETTALSQWERAHHLKSDPEGIRYPCSSCEYKSRNKGKFNSHIQVKHNGGSQKFPCSQCEYKVSII